MSNAKGRVHEIRDTRHDDSICDRSTSCDPLFLVSSVMLHMHVYICMSYVIHFSSLAFLYTQRLLIRLTWSDQPYHLYDRRVFQAYGKISLHGMQYGHFTSSGTMVAVPDSASLTCCSLAADGVCTRTALHEEAALSFLEKHRSATLLNFHFLLLERHCTKLEL